MKKTIIKSVIFLLTFLVALLVAGRVMNHDNQNMTMELSEASFPIITLEKGDISYNELHGYAREMDVAYQRGTIAELGENRELVFRIETYGLPIESIDMEVRSRDGSRLIENTPIREYEPGNTIRVETALKDLIEKDTEYSLVLVLTDGSSREIRYYTRVIWSDNTCGYEKLEYVRDFHEKTFDREAARDLIKYLESNSQGDNTSFHKVDIHSSFHQITWGELDVRRLTEPAINLMELATQTAAMQLSYLVSTGSGKDQVCYLVEELYRIRYTPDRVYLLGFERTMDQIPAIKGNIYANDKIMLGIVGEDVALLESEDGNIVVFEAAGRLCSYNAASNRLALLFSFYEDTSQNAKPQWDARDLYQQYGLKILGVDEGNNVQFAVYGYMNRGRHEGEVGIQLYTYNSAHNTIEEIVYIPYDKSYEILAAELEQLLYMNREGKLYLYLNHGIYEVNTLERTSERIALVETDEAMVISDNHKIIVWWQEQGLQMMDLGTEQLLQIEVGADEIARPLGFMGEDIIYGVARREDVVADAVGRQIFPMYQVCIRNSSGKLMKAYEQENIYTLSCRVEENQIILERVLRREDGSYVNTTREQIMNSAPQETGRNQLVIAAVDVYEKLVQLQVRDEINVKGLQVLTPKEVVFEGGRNVDLQTDIRQERYYVYDLGRIEGIYYEPAQAINQANACFGVVVNDRGRTIWIRGNRAVRNQIMAIKAPAMMEEKSSLAVCLDTMLELEGIVRNTEQQLRRGRTALQILEQELDGKAQVMDLSGCSLDAMLYFINQDIPVLAIQRSGEAVLLTGFNEFNVVVMEPSSGKLYKKGMNDTREWMEENGNPFIAYIRMED
ncbi:MAG: hypothetical protein NC543_12590 [bacterium]|nr:hypothetical protein [bacterium]MCM1375306.1 hypothetical protein [Muribaculum sp.]MCM1409777.1 hypothetical protein [Lachnospiraceae bacterium]